MRFAIAAAALVALAVVLAARRPPRYRTWREYVESDDGCEPWMFV